MRKLSDMFLSSAMKLEERLATDVSLNNRPYQKASVQRLREKLIAQAAEQEKKGN